MLRSPSRGSTEVYDPYSLFIDTESGMATAAEALDRPVFGGKSRSLLHVARGDI